MIKKIKSYIKKNKLKNFKFFKSLGSQNYLSVVKFLDGVIGNSSSGVSEVPFFGIKTINLGDRQLGRISAPSVINCDVSEKKIKLALKKIFISNNKINKKKKFPIFGNGNTSKKIAMKISNFNFKKYKKKIFTDLGL